MIVRLWLVRHGSTESTDGGKFLGWKDEPLNSRGLLQAERLRASTDSLAFESIWSSDLLRSVQTAAVLADQFEKDKRLREIDFGLLEGKTWDECEPELQASLLEFDNFCAPGGESVIQLRSRVEQFLSELSKGDHLIATHGGVIRTLLREIEDDRAVAPGDLVVMDWTNRRVITRQRLEEIKPVGSLQWRPGMPSAHEGM